jgi:hypothetical protein
MSRLWRKFRNFYKVESLSFVLCVVFIIKV